jgi:hypothetical protein
VGVVVELELRTAPAYWVRPCTVLLPLPALCAGAQEVRFRRCRVPPPVTWDTGGKGAR